MFPREKRLMAEKTAATDDSGLRPLFENPLPENPTLLESLSACHRSVHPTTNKKPIDPASFTEIFGELHFHEKQQEPKPASTVQATGSAAGEEEEEEEKKRPLKTTFPPPIRSIGPRVWFRSFRADGRLVVTEVVTPGRELLQASREGGRLRLQFAAAAAGVVGVDDEEMREHEDEDYGEGTK
ncbi:unnamed protein product [Urochloa humidicola]